MKLLKLASLSCLIISALAGANEINFQSNQVNILNKYMTTSAPTTEEIERLKKQEALLKAILENSEYIQLKDGSAIDLRDFSEFQENLPNFDFNTIDSIRENVRTTISSEGGTGAGG